MELFRSIVPEDPTDNEVALVMSLYAIILFLMMGSVWLLCQYNPLRRLTRWWNRFTTETTIPPPLPPSITPTAILLPNVLPRTSSQSTLSSTTVANNRARNQVLPGAFVDEQGSTVDLSPNDFKQPFMDYTEQDVANMRAAWKKCHEGRAADVAARKTETSPPQTDASAASTETRDSMAAKGRQAELAKNPGTAAKDQLHTAPKTGNTIKCPYPTEITGVPVTYPENPATQVLIKDLKKHNEELREEIAAGLRARCRPGGPGNVQELQKELEAVRRTNGTLRREARDHDRRARKAETKLVISGIIVSGWGDRQHDLHSAEAAQATIRQLQHQVDLLQADAGNHANEAAAQQNAIAQHLVDLAQHRANETARVSAINEQADAMRQYEASHAEAKEIIKEQDDQIEQYKVTEKASQQATAMAESELNALQQKLRAQEKELANIAKDREFESRGIDMMHEHIKEQDSKIKQLMSDKDQNPKIMKLESEARKNNSKIKALLRSRDKSNAELELLRPRLTKTRCLLKAARETFENDLKAWEARVRVLNKQVGDGSSQVDGLQTRLKLVRTQRDNMMKVCKARGTEIERLGGSLQLPQFAFEVAGSALVCMRCPEHEAEVSRLNQLLASPAECEECAVRQAEVGQSAAPIDCKKCTEHEAEVARLNELLAAPVEKPPVERDSQAQVADQSEQTAASAAAKATPSGPEEVSEIGQLKIWLEESRLSLCSMMERDPGPAQVLLQGNFAPNALKDLLAELAQECKAGKEMRERTMQLEFNLEARDVEIETLKKHLTTTQEELREARKPEKSRAGDPRIRKIAELTQTIKELKAKLDDEADKADAEIDALEEEIESLKKKLEACEGRHHGSAPDATSLQAELEQAQRDCTAAQNEAKKNADQLAEERKKNASTVDNLEAELKKTRGERITAQNLAQEKIDELAGSRKNNAARIAGLKREIEDAKAAAPIFKDADAQKVVDEMRAELNDNHVKIADLTAENEKLSTENGEYLAIQYDDSQTIATLRKDLEAAQAEKAYLKHGTNPATSKTRDEKGQLIAEANSKLQKAEEQVQALQKTSPKDSSDTKAEVERLQKVVEGLEEKLDTAYRAWNKFGPLSVKLGEELEAEKAEVKSLQKQLQNAKAQEQAALRELHGQGNQVIDELKSQLSEAQMDLDVADQDLQNAVANHSQVASQMSDMEFEFNEQTEQLQHLQNRISEMKQVIRERDHTIEGMRAKYGGGTLPKSFADNDLRKRYDDLNRNYIKLQHQNQELQTAKAAMPDTNVKNLQKSLDDEQKRRAKAEDRYNKVFGEVEKLRNRVNDLTTQLQDAKDDLEELQKIHARCSSKTTTLAAQNPNLDPALFAQPTAQNLDARTIAHFTPQLTAARNELQHVKSIHHDQLANVRNENHQLQQRVQELANRKDPAELTNKINGLEKEIQQLEAQIHSLEDQNEILQEKVDELEVTLAKEKAAGESVERRFDTRNDYEAARAQVEAAGPRPGVEEGGVQDRGRGAGTRRKMDDDIGPEGEKEDEDVNGRKKNRPNEEDDDDLFGPDFARSLPGARDVDDRKVL